MCRDHVEEDDKNSEGGKLCCMYPKHSLHITQRLKGCLILNNLRAVIIPVFLSTLYSQCLIYSSIHSVNKYFLSSYKVPEVTKAKHLVSKALSDSVIQPLSAWSNKPLSLSVQISLRLALFPSSKPFPNYITVKLERGCSTFRPSASPPRMLFPEGEIPLKELRMRRERLLSSWKSLGDSPLQCVRIGSRVLLEHSHVTTTMLSLKGSLREERSFKMLFPPQKVYQ